MNQDLIQEGLKNNCFISEIINNSNFSEDKANFFLKSTVDTLGLIKEISSSRENLTETLNYFKSILISSNNSNEFQTKLNNIAINIHNKYGVSINFLMLFSSLTRVNDNDIRLLSSTLAHCSLIDKSVYGSYEFCAIFPNREDGVIAKHIGDHFIPRNGNDSLNSYNEYKKIFNTPLKNNIFFIKLFSKLFFLKKIFLFLKLFLKNYIKNIPALFFIFVLTNISPCIFLFYTLQLYELRKLPYILIYSKIIYSTISLATLCLLCKYYFIATVIISAIIYTKCIISDTINAITTNTTILQSMELKKIIGIGGDGLCKAIGETISNNSIRPKIGEFLFSDEVRDFITAKNNGNRNNGRFIKTYDLPELNRITSKTYQSLTQSKNEGIQQAINNETKMPNVFRDILNNNIINSL
ncbi:hypothetical protein [Lyticum sinuosum]|uniref:Uncharacterized protein n=1 Tax=Lyticum sinuosum TaxID=1332059 RepID=A0AAE4VJJ2_9RICK|nr:hypothetical protein [Lyticum sinuosum]MDZ5760992.1 hypothetical protein [Lyticum sinuosum]